MVSIIQAQNPSESPLARAIVDLGKSMFGDTLTPALKRERLRGETMKNDVYSPLAEAVAAKTGLGDLTNNPYMRTAMFLNGIKPDDIYGAHTGERLITPDASGNYVNPASQGITNGMLASGRAYSTTPAGFNEAQANEIGMNNARIAEQARQFDMKPMEALVTAPDQNAVGPFMPGMQPTVTQPGFVTQRDAVSNPDVRPIQTQSVSDLGKKTAELEALKQHIATLPMGSPERARAEETLSIYMRNLNSTPGVAGPTMKADEATLKTDMETVSKFQNQKIVLDQMENLIDNGAITGSLSSVRLGAEKLGALVGGPQEQAAATEVLRNLSNQNIMASIGSLGSGISEGDRKFVENMSPNLDTSPLGVKQGIVTQRAIARRQAELAQARYDYAAQNGSLYGFDPSSVAAKPLFTPAEAAKIQGSSSGPQVGAIEDGHVFRGGNPADPANWERVQ